MTIQKEVKARLRVLRLWHWESVKSFRAKSNHKQANLHLGFVQSLNSFFEAGDTAENDEWESFVYGERWAYIKEGLK